MFLFHHILFNKTINLSHHSQLFSVAAIQLLCYRFGQYPGFQSIQKYGFHSCHKDTFLEIFDFHIVCGSPRTDFSWFVCPPQWNLPMNQGILSHSPPTALCFGVLGNKAQADFVFAIILYFVKYAFISYLYSLRKKN